nr:MAG TPA: hypothetical protein [Caudoviricetes sp.]
MLCLPGRRCCLNGHVFRVSRFRLVNQWDVAHPHPPASFREHTPPRSLQYII